MSPIHQLKRERPDLFAKLSYLNKKSTWINVVYLFVDYAMIATAIFLSLTFSHILVYLLAIFVIGSRMRALDNLLHEASHGALFPHRMLNHICGSVLCAFPVGSSMHAYRKSHMAHHSCLGDETKDPDLIRYRNIGMDKLPMEKTQLLQRILRVVLLRDTFVYLQNTFSSFMYAKGTPKKEKILRTLFFTVLGFCLWFFQLEWFFFLYWVIPFLTTLQMIRFFAEISEHGALYEEEEEIEMTRNNLIHPIARFFIYPHGDAYHMTHHLLPAVPHYHLSHAHEILMNWTPYANAHHCYGYFNTGLTNLPSTVSEMIQKQDVKKNPIAQSSSS